jgi:hypothetical protein
MIVDYSSSTTNATATATASYNATAANIVGSLCGLIIREGLSVYRCQRNEMQCNAMRC